MSAVEWSIGADELAELVPPIVKGDRDKFVRAIAGMLGGLGGPLGKAAAEGLYDRLHTNKNDRLFQRFLDDEKSEEAQAGLVAAIREGLQGVHGQDRVALIRVIHIRADELGRKLDKLTEHFGVTQDAIPADARYVTAFAAWAPVAKKLDRVGLDLMDSRMYVLRSPSSPEDASRQLRDLNEMIRIYNRAVDAVKHEWRLHGSELLQASNINATWKVLEEAISVAREFESCAEFPVAAAEQARQPDDEFRETHLAMVQRFDEIARKLTTQRDRLRSEWKRAELEVQRFVEGMAKRDSDPADPALAEVVRDLILPYFAAVSEVVTILRQRSDQPESELNALREWVERELVPAVVSLNTRVAWIYDSGAAAILKMAVTSPSTASLEMLRFVEGLSVFHSERIRDPLNRALVPMLRIDEDAAAPVRSCLATVRKVLVEHENAFQKELLDYQWQAELLAERAQ